MRLPSATTLLSAAAALTVLTACGGGSDEEATTSSGTSSSSAGSSSAPESTVEADVETLTFCAEVQTAIADVGPALETATPETLPGVLRQIVDGLDGIDAPADIATDFDTLRAGYGTLLDSATTNDLGTPEGETAFQETLASVSAEAGAAETAIGSWLETNCPAEDASPTS